MSEPIYFESATRRRCRALLTVVGDRFELHREDDLTFLGAFTPAGPQALTVERIGALLDAAAERVDVDRYKSASRLPDNGMVLGPGPGKGLSPRGDKPRILPYVKHRDERSGEETSVMLSIGAVEGSVQIRVRAHDATVMETITFGAGASHAAAVMLGDARVEAVRLWNATLKEVREEKPVRRPSLVRPTVIVHCLDEPTLLISFEHAREVLGDGEAEQTRGFFAMNEAVWAIPHPDRIR